MTAPVSVPNRFAIVEPSGLHMVIFLADRLHHFPQLMAALRPIPFWSYTYDTLVLSTVVDAETAEKIFMTKATYHTIEDMDFRPLLEQLNGEIWYFQTDDAVQLDRCVREAIDSIEHALSWDHERLHHLIELVYQILSNLKPLYGGKWDVEFWNVVFECWRQKYKADPIPLYSVELGLSDQELQIKMNVMAKRFNG